MRDGWAAAESERAVNNLIRLGVVMEVDAAERRARVRFGGLESEWLPWGVSRAGTTRTASAPSVGEQRVIFSPYGDTAQAVIGPAIYQDDHDAPTDSADVHIAEFPDGTRVSYDSASHALTVDAGTATVVVNCQSATIAAESVTLDAPETHCTGALIVDGDATFNGGAVTHGGKSIGKTHTHIGVQSGSATSGPPT
ncbi:MAG: phage baseplate assembly protein V [Sphingopyxis macrogoltabida]|uniref:Phage baseplate assembly protein V n=1 Tax=Sphingopyxis macrogoltabida TaxID=33050 RepID=A0A2W5L0U8_SPHMC|nr:MAG: phage baseplate assembly protein V [Sphingopyxis macrogoltabida]